MTWIIILIAEPSVYVYVLNHIINIKQLTVIYSYCLYLQSHQFHEGTIWPITLLLLRHFVLTKKGINK
jgi:hypothetical protein